MESQTGTNISKQKFEVHLENFDGPFDLLLSLISKHQLDITHISISQVTDEFIEFVRMFNEDHKLLDETSQFLLIAATLLEIKAARLLPGNKDFNEEDLELLEARDLLFAKLLQYKAFKEIGIEFGKKIDLQHSKYPYESPLEPQFKAVLPELIWDTNVLDIHNFASNAFSIFQLRNSDVNLDHIHMRQVNVAEQSDIICKRLKKHKKLSFDELIKDAKFPQVIIGRFLSLLELYKLNAIDFEQQKSLGKLVINWIADNDFEYKKVMSISDFD